jgi:uncharacterized membrane protein YfcA
MFMENMLIQTIPYVLSGGLVGLLVGLTGVGGGSLMTPLLTLIFGISPSVAVGTDLAFAAITKGVGTIAHRMHGHIRWNIVKLLCLGSLTTALITLFVLKQVGNLNEHWQSFIQVSIGISVILTALSIVFRKKMLVWLDRHPQFQLMGHSLTIATILLGAVIGVLVTISSIGAGAIGATGILLLYPKLKPADVAGTDIAYAVPLTALAGLGHWWLGNVNFMLLGGLLIGSIPAIWLGAKLSKQLPERYTRSALAVVLTLVGFKLVI